MLLADEPTGNLDSASARDVMALLRTMHDERGQTIVLVTHDARVAARADRVITMRDGAIANETRLDERPRRRRRDRLAPDAAGGVTMTPPTRCAAAPRAIAPRRPRPAGRSRPALTALAIFAAATALVVTLALRSGLDDPFAQAQDATRGAHVGISRATLDDAQIDALTRPPGVVASDARPEAFGTTTLAAARVDVRRQGLPAARRRRRRPARDRRPAPERPPARCCWSAASRARPACASARR